MSRSCDAIGCNTPTASGRFMCLHHWRMVPTVTQRTINARYRAHKVAHTLLRDARYVQACAVAIESVAATEGKAAGGNSYRRLLNLLTSKEAA